MTARSETKERLRTCARCGATGVHIYDSTGVCRPCSSCNNGLGRFKDDPTRLAEALAYVLRHREGRRAA